MHLFQYRVLAGSLLLSAFSAVAAAGAANPSSGAALPVCPSDVVVWLAAPQPVAAGAPNPRVFFSAGDPRFAVAAGKYACEKAALSTGAVLDQLASALSFGPAVEHADIDALVRQGGANAVSGHPVVGHSAVTDFIGRSPDAAIVGGDQGTATGANVAAPIVAQPSPAANNNTWVSQRVFYATDRQPTNTKAKYGTQPGPMQYGYADVAIPAFHRPDPQTFLSMIVSVFQHKGPSQALSLVNTSVETLPAFRVDLQTAVQRSPQHDAFVFVHGFNTPWSAAIESTAEIAFDLNFPGPAISYSWPSVGDGTAFSLLLYGRDKQRASDAAPDLAALLEDITANSGVEQVHIITHSMGAYELCMALAQIKLEGHPSLQKIHDISMAAPDVSVDQFGPTFAALLSATSNDNTYYVSSKDLAMIGSLEWSGDRPLGDGNPLLTIVPGYSVVDASAIDTDFLGHGYFLDQPEVVEDFAQNFSANPYPHPLVHAHLQGTSTYYAF
jgi:esterase/lipase superfamily enzyme